MQQLDGQVYQGYEEEYPGDDSQEEELETVTVYYYTTQPTPPRRPVPDVVIALVALVCLIGGIAALCLIPTSPAYTVTTLRIPAHIRPLTLQTTVQVIPTGIHSYPATQASGALTVYNGSFLTQQLPAHFIVTTASGVEVETDQTVTVPPAAPPSLGTATVTARAVVGGVGGNIAALTVDQAYAPLYIKNLSAFTGGQDAYTESYATSQDVNSALDTAREQLNAKQPAGLTTGPCGEKASQKALTLAVSWACSYVTYTVPAGAQVVSVKVVGSMVVLQVRVQRKAAISQWSHR